jgi:DNA-binding transcriptional LysR family regulator
MELRQLEQFVAVAEDGNFTRAARRLNRAQSGVSASIQALEHELGAALFRRSTRRVTLTEAGRVLLVEARRTLDAALAAQEAVAAVQGLARGTLRVGTTERLPAGLDLAAILTQFHSMYPDVVIRLQMGPYAELLDRVREGDLNVAFVTPFGPVPRELNTTLLARDVLMLACSSSHLLASRVQVTAADLTGESFIELSSLSGLQTYLSRATGVSGLSRRLVAEVERLPALLDLVAQGLGIAVVPHLARAYPAAVRYVPLVPRVVVEHVVAVSEDPPPSAAARALVALISALAEPLSHDA